MDPKMGQAGKIHPDEAEFDSVALQRKSDEAVDIYPNGEKYNSAPPLPGYSYGGAFNSLVPPPGSYYNVREQHLPAPATYQRGRRARGACCCLLSCLCSILTILAILVGIAIFVFWIIVQPKAPKFQVQNVHISGLNATSGPLNTNITFELLARNPNKKMSFYYDDFTVEVETDGVPIGDGSIPSFYQGHKNTKYLTSDLSAEGVILTSSTVDLLNIGNNRNVPLYAKVDVKARVKVGSVKSHKIKIKVRCDLNVDLSVTDGSQLTYNNCHVNW